MPIIWHTKNINIQDYYKSIRRIIMINGDNGTHLSGYKAWQEYKENWTLHIIPVDRAEEFKKFYEHLNVTVSDGIAWGVTGYKEQWVFVKDSRDAFKTRSNIMPLGHELLHALYQDQVGTFHITRKFDTPEGRARTQGAAATVIVHDNWYGTKITKRFWISWGIGWLPITYPYIPIWKAKEQYAI